jgi:FAD-dependent urate hydroxylase
MSAVKDHPQPQLSVYADGCDALVVGAGPYGLSAAAHLRGRGMRVMIFGRPAGLWRERMPSGMRLRSHWWASNLSEPFGRYRLGEYLERFGYPPDQPLPIEAFIGYALWFQQHVIPDVDETFVERVEHDGQQFRVALVDGRVIQSRAVVMAPGLHYYAHRPAEYDGLPPDLVSHTGDHTVLERFGGQTVAVMGGGQSAVETAALLHERGAQVHLIARRPIVWLPEYLGHKRPLIERALRPEAGIGPGWLPWGLEHAPYVFQRLPRSTKDRLMHLAGPAAASWLKPRVQGRVFLHEAQSVRTVKVAADGLDLTLANAETIRVDHLVLGTGYRVDITRLPMFAPSLVAHVRTFGGSPVLSSWFESSIPGLYFAGISSYASCGPLFRFVVGTDAAARRIADAVEGRVAQARAHDAATIMSSMSSAGSARRSRETA